MDRPMEPVEADVREPGGGVGPELPPEAVLGSEDEVGIVTLLAERPDGVAGDHDVAAFDECHVGRDDQDALLFQRGSYFSVS